MSDVQKPNLLAISISKIKRACARVCACACPSFYLYMSMSMVGWLG